MTMELLMGISVGIGSVLVAIRIIKAYNEKRNWKKYIKAKETRKG